MQAEFREKADAIASKQIHTLRRVVKEDRAVGVLKSKHIRQDVHQVTEMAVVDLTIEINDAAKDIKQILKQKVEEIEKEVVNEYLEERGLRGTEMDQNGESKKEEKNDYNKEDGKKDKEATEDKIEAKGKEEVSERTT